MHGRRALVVVACCASVVAAAVAQAGSVLDVRFTDGFFAINSLMRGNIMQGQINAAGITLFADRGFSYYYYERLPDDERPAVSGR